MTVKVQSVARKTLVERKEKKVDKQSLIKDMTKFAGNRPFITKTRLGRFLGKKDAWARQIVQGLDKIPGEAKGDKYYIPDVVERLLQERRA